MLTDFSLLQLLSNLLYVHCHTVGIILQYCQFCSDWLPSIVPHLESSLGMNVQS